MTICKIRGCTDEMHFQYLGVCKACYSGLSYWKGRPRAHKQKRLDQLKRLNGRMSSMIDNPYSVPRKRQRKKPIST